MLSLPAADLSPLEIQTYLQYAIAPRPICFASTVDTAGNVNLSPFSFFNLFSVNPPVCVFSPSRRVRDNTTKHTLENISEVPECVINVVTADMVQQASLSSVEYPKGVNEFIKAGFTALPSRLVQPPRVAESPVQLECSVRQIIPLGSAGGAGNLVLAEVVFLHVSESILDVSGTIDQRKLNLVARLGGDWYCRVGPENLFQVTKPVRTVGLGVDALPESVRNSSILTGNNLGQLGNTEKLPDEKALDDYRSKPEIKNILAEPDSSIRHTLLHTLARQLLEEGKVEEAWKVLLIG